MTRTGIKLFVVALMLFAFASGGCWTGEALMKIGNGMESELQRKAGNLQNTLDKIGESFKASANEKTERAGEFGDFLAKKYKEGHQSSKLVFFPDEQAASVPEKAAAGAGPGLAAAAQVPAVDVRSELLSERTLQHRGLSLLWKLPLDGTGVQYAKLDGDYLYVVTLSNRLYALDVRQGLTRWIYNIGRRPDGPLGFNEDYVVLSAGDVIRVIDKNLGEETTRFDTDIQPAGRPFCNSQYSVFGCWTGQVVGFRFGERYPIWSYQTGEPVFLPPYVQDEFAYAANEKGALIRYQITRGATAGQIDLGGQPVDMASTKDFLYVSLDNYRTSCIGLEGFLVEWTHTSDGRVTAGPWLSADATVLFYTAEDDGFYAITALTGKDRWKVVDGQLPVAASKDSLYLLRSDQTLCKVDSGTGNVVWAESIAPFVTAVCQLQTGTVFLISQDGQIYALATSK